MGWTSRRVVVRVRGRAREVEVALPGERPVSALLPGLIAMCEEQGRAVPTETAWRLVRTDGSELPPGSTLLSAGVDDGTALVLRNAARADSPADRRRRLEAAIRDRPLWPALTIAVASPKGGVGKTTVTLLVGAAIAQLRPDRVIAIDADPDYGTLGRGIGGRPMFVDELAALVDQPALNAPMLDRWLAQGPEGLRILPAPVDPNRMDALDEATYAQVIDRVRELARVVIVDCGAGMRSPATRAALAAADQLVLVTDTEPATMALVGDAARDLGRDRPYALVVNKVPRSGLDMEEVAARVPNARAVVELPADRNFARRLTGPAANWTAGPPAWRHAARELAAGLVGGWELLKTG